MRKIIFIFASLFILFTNKIFAVSKDTFVTVTNPVRGSETWGDIKQDPLALPKFQYNVATASSAPVTWMLRYDVIKDASMSAYFEHLYAINDKQSLGAFLEITPNLAKDSNVEYLGGNSYFNANRVFLSGYYPEQRVKLIDTYMNTFKKRYGFLPRSVGAWHIDSNSLDYLNKKYSIQVALICDEQYSTDGYRLWGGYLGSPYIPSKKNVLIPSQSENDRINLVIIRWAQRDLYNFYGSSKESLSSIQVKDYLNLNRSTQYFEKIIRQYSQKDFNEFTHINLGLENDYSLLLYGSELKNTFKSIDSLTKELSLKYISLDTLANYVLNLYPQSSPAYFYQVNDPLNPNSGNKIYWYQNSYYRLGLKYESGQTKIIDFRTYNAKLFEDYFSTPNNNDKLYLEVPAIIDSVKYPNSELNLDINLSKAQITFENWRVKFVDGQKQINLNPQNIEFTNIFPHIETKDIKVKQNQILTWIIQPKLPFSEIFNHLIIVAIIFIPLIIFLFFHNRILSIGLLIAFLTILTVIRSGDLYSFGLGIWGPNGHDAIFHISLIEKFANNPLNFDHPQIAGEKLINYHFVFDYISGLITKTFNINANFVYFILFPVITSITLVILLKSLFEKWKLKNNEKYLSYIFVFLAGSLGYIPALLSGSNPLYSESIFWANQSTSMFLNPPFTLSLIILIVFLLLLEKVEQPKWKELLILGLVGGLLAQTKIYAFILLCLSLLMTKKYRILFLVGVIGVLITLPFSKSTGLPFSLDPLWFTRSLFASYDRVWWPRLAQAWQTYESSGSWLKLLIVNSFAVLVFLVGNLGIRLFALPKFFAGNLKLSQKISLIISLIGIVLPLVIIQKLNPWNTIQFIYYSLFFLGIFAAIEVSQIIQRIKNKIIKYFFASIIVFLSIFTGIGTVYSYLGSLSSSRISYTELYALEKLRSQPYGLVLSPLFNSKLANIIATPKPLYSYASTAYISAYSNKPEYLSDTINLDITGFNYNQKSRQVQRFYQTENKTWAIKFLQTEQITYVYETQLSHIRLNPFDICLSKIFDSGEINIYKFNCHVQK